MGGSEFLSRLSASLDKVLISRDLETAPLSEGCLSWRDSDAGTLLLSRECGIFECSLRRLCGGLGRGDIPDWAHDGNLSISAGYMAWILLSHEVLCAVLVHAVSQRLRAPWMDDLRVVDP